MKIQSGLGEGGFGFGPFLLLAGPTSSALGAPRTAPDLFDFAGYGTQRATLKASMCLEAFEAKVAY